MRALSYQELNARSRPADPNQPEVFPDVLFDTQTYTDNATTSLSFFGSVQADSSLGNIPAQGQLDEGHFLVVEEIHLDAFRANAIENAAGVNGMYNDLWQLIVTGRPHLTLTMRNKTYGPYPVAMCRPLGGIWGMGYGTYAASNHTQLASISPMNVGLRFNGGLIIPPRLAIRAVITWPAVVNTTLGDFSVRLALRGDHYRPVA